MEAISPIDEAWKLLKMTMAESRQTELGEFHPNFPSSHGPMTAVRVIPRVYLDEVSRAGVLPLSGDESGVASDVREHNVDFERRRPEMSELTGKNLKQFDLSGPGTWWTKPSVTNVRRSFTRAGRQGPALVGVRGNLDDFKHQKRDAHETTEHLPEMYMEDTVPPERTVRMDQPPGNYDWKWTDPKETWGKTPKDAASLADMYGLDDEWVDYERRIKKPEDESEMNW